MDLVFRVRIHAKYDVFFWFFFYDQACGQEGRPKNITVPDDTPDNANDDNDTQFMIVLAPWYLCQLRFSGCPVAPGYLILMPVATWLPIHLRISLKFV